MSVASIGTMVVRSGWTSVGGRWLMACASLVALGAGCKSGAQTPPQASASAQAAASSAPAPKPGPTARPSASAAAPVPVYSSHDPGIAVPYSLTARDCDDLAEHYAEVTRLDARAALPATLSDKQRAASEPSIQQAAEEARAMWTKQCDGLIDMPYEKSRIDCALASKTVAAYSACINK